MSEKSSKNIYRESRSAVLWTLTNECNQECEYCYQNSKLSKTAELSLREKKRMAYELVNAGISYITFTGGEPLLRLDQLCKLSDYSTSLGITGIGVLTGGTMLSQKVIRKLKSSGVRSLHINFDSVDRETHDSFRKKSGYWEKTLDGILNSVEEGMITEIMATISKRNFQGVGRLIKFSRQLGVRLGIGALIPIGRGSKMEAECLNQDELGALFEIISKYSFDDNDSVRMATNPDFIPYLKDNFQEKMVSSNYGDLNCIIGCLAGTGWCAIQPDGKVTPCSLMPNFVVGDLRKQSFGEIWHNSPIFKKLRDRENLEGKCGSCSNRDSCGGCRARAYENTGNYLAEDSACYQFGM